MTYEWKRVEEALWSVAVAAALYIAQIAAELDIDEVATDPRAYIVAAAGGLVRAIGGAMLAALSRNKS